MRRQLIFWGARQALAFALTTLGLVPAARGADPLVSRPGRQQRPIEALCNSFHSARPHGEARIYRFASSGPPLPIIQRMTLIGGEQSMLRLLQANLGDSRVVAVVDKTPPASYGLPWQITKMATMHVLERGLAGRALVTQYKPGLHAYFSPGRKEDRELIWTEQFCPSPPHRAVAAELLPTPAGVSPRRLPLTSAERIDLDPQQVLIAATRKPTREGGIWSLTECFAVIQPWSAASRGLPSAHWAQVMR